jgi:wobble nucleotide-excising tRNase
MKLNSEIKKVIVSDATFKNSVAEFEPTYINYFFGNNGTGKSTIAKAIGSGTGVTFPTGKSAADYDILLFNQDYIDDNVRSYRGMPSVFTIGEKNSKTQEEIDHQIEEQEKDQKALEDATAEKGKKDKQLSKLKKQLWKDCWEKTADIRDGDFPKAMGGIHGSQQKYTEEVQRHKPIDHVPEKLKLQYEATYSDNAKRYARFSTIADASVLDTLEGKEILSVAIVNSSETQLAAFLKKIGATEWAREGHSMFQQAAGDRCPYCGRIHDPNFEDEFTKSFDDQYEQNRAKLETFLNDYRNKANQLFIPLEKIPDPMYPAIDVKPYQDKVAAIKAVISGNIEKIKEKIKEPAKTVTLQDTQPSLDDLEKLIDEYNSLIDENNAAVDAGPKKRQEVRDDVLEMAAYRLKDVFESYARSEQALGDEIKAQDDIIKFQTDNLAAIKTKLADLNKATVETETAMKHINARLKDSGFQGFELRPKAEEVVQPDGTIKKVVPVPARNYEVIRTETEEPAERLSEGEKNFIAFLYFLEQVYGSSDSSGNRKDKIVVIDDPVSSMDSGTLFIVGAEIRKLVEICRNNADNRDPVYPGNFIKQLFIFTHNAYFHREVTYPYADRYEFVSFYLIKKRNNQSSIELKEAQDPNCPSEKININPVKNSYVALWDEYRELNSGVALLNVIRRILEYYFIQLCGYQGNDLSKCILEEHKDAFMHDESGAEDQDRYKMASAMLSYISTESSRFNDGFQYVDDYPDVDLCRKVFKMIFHYMQQEQHYNMMMKIQG